MCTRELNDIFMKTTISGGSVCLAYYMQFVLSLLFLGPFITESFIFDGKEGEGEGGGSVCQTRNGRTIGRGKEGEKVLPQRNLFSFYCQYCCELLHVGDLMSLLKEEKKLKCES